MDRHTWDAAQQAGAEHATSRDGDDLSTHPATRRRYLLRSRIRCKICQRRMCGITRTHPERGPAGDYAYYLCPHNPANPRHAATAPDHPRTVTAPENLLLSVLRAGLSAYALAPGRAGRLRQLLPAGAAGQQARHDTQAAALSLRLKQIDTAEKNLITELDAAAQLPATAAGAYRARIRERFTQLCTERDTITAQLTELAHHTSQHGNDPTLIDELPELAGRLDELPERIQAHLFAAFDIQILWNPPMRQATIYATITDTTPGIITDLLTRASDDDPATAHPGPPPPAQTPA